ncbi:MAG: response regulator transcription factor [Flavobacterium sp.]|nr:response regulator transcription factor [Flavobacterium sp.]
MIEKFEFIEKENSDNLPDIIIVDVYMPLMNGFEAVEWLKVNYPKIQIIIVSSSEEEINVLRMVKLGVNSYVNKSNITNEGLRNVVNEVTKKGNYFDKNVAEIVIKSYQNSELNLDKNIVLSLTEKEKDVIKLVCKEMTSSEIAKALFVSPRTIDSFRHNIITKLNVKSMVGVALFAQRNGLLNT